jgi:hypothetical protein
MDDIKALLQKIAALESSRGTNQNHPVITKGLQAGQQAIGTYGLLPNTIRERIQSLKNRHVNVPQGFEQIKGMSDDDIRSNVNPEVEQYLAEDLMSTIFNRAGGDADKAAYMWNSGHNLDPSKITPEALESNPYVQKFKALKDRIK